MKKDSKIFVAGHKGMVGSAILENLKKRGYTNFALRTSSELNLTNQKDVLDFFEKEKPEFVFLAAGKVGGIKANNTYRAQFIYENLMIESNVIHSSWISNVKKILFLGSSCIYPRDAPQPISEESLLTSPLEYTNEPYAIAKIAGIRMCESYNLQYGANYISVMPTNLYGPNDNFNFETAHVLPALIRKIYLGKCLENNNWNAIREDLNRRPVEEFNGESAEKEILAILNKYGISVSEKNSVSVEIWGSGAPSRDFLWSEELADACVFVMENIDANDVIPPFGEVRNTHLNIGTGVEISIKELALLIKTKVGFSGSIYFNASKPDGTLRKALDTSKINSLGWHYKIEIEEGIEKLINWYTTS